MNSSCFDRLSTNGVSNVADRTLARRYAEAFVNRLEISRERERGLEELRGVAQVYSGSKELRRFMGSPEIGLEEKQQLLGKVLSEGASDETMGLLKLLLKRDRMEELPGVADEAASISEARQGILRGQVTTAHPISSAETDRLAQAVGKAVRKRVILERQVDPALIGGVRVAVGSVMLDGSVRAQLKRVKEQLKAAKVN